MATTAAAATLWEQVSDITYVFTQEFWEIEKKKKQSI